ncbi:MAG: DUF4303 domain-containing protein [Oscillospiraceae bacterium]|nr:DUF4303 domain-containing protein [Oscillospiraceae bacterium]
MKSEINLELFFKEISKKIKAAVKHDFPIMQKNFENETPYAVVFETDSDCVTLSLVVNTYEALKAKDDEYAKKGYGGTKWFPNEWRYWPDYKQGCEIYKIADELSEMTNSIWDEVRKQTPDMTYEEREALCEEYKFTELFFETVTSAFLELIRSDVFGLNPDEITYFISMSDDNRVEEIENNSAKVLNTEKVYEAFSKRFDHLNRSGG